MNDYQKYRRSKSAEGRMAIGGDIITLFNSANIVNNKAMLKKYLSW